jgi:hypothetical protein
MPAQYSLTETLFLSLEAILPTIKHPAIGVLMPGPLFIESEYADYATSRKQC